MVVNEDPWVARCPVCGNTDQNQQVPITLALPSQCQACEVNPWKGRSNYEEILYFMCFNPACPGFEGVRVRYLTPKLDAKDVLLGALES